MWQLNILFIFILWIAILKKLLLKVIILKFDQAYTFWKLNFTVQKK